MEEVSFQSLPFPFPESGREELIRYRQLAAAKESELARRKVLKLQQLKDYVSRRLGEIEKTKHARARTKLNNLDTSSEAVPTTTEQTPHIKLHHQHENPSRQQQGLAASQVSPPSNGAMPVSTTSPFMCAFSPHTSPTPSSPFSISSSPICTSPSPQKQSLSPQRQSPSPQSKQSSVSPLFSATRRTPPRSRGPLFSSIQRVSSPPSSSPRPPRVLFTSKHSPPHSPTLSPHRPITSSPRTPQSHHHHTPTITATPSPGVNRSRDRHVKLAAVWSHGNGGGPPQRSPMQGLLSNIAGRKKNSLSPGKKKQQRDAATKLSALVKGYLTRRLLSAEKIQDIVTTIHDAESVLLSLNNPTMPQDFDLQQRVISQLQAAKLQLHDIFFYLTPEQRMAYISHSRLLRQERTFRKILMGNQQQQGASDCLKKGRLSSATVKSLQRKRRADESTLATITNKPLPVTEPHSRLHHTIHVPTTRQSVPSRTATSVSLGKRTSSSARNTATSKTVRKSVPVGGKVGGAKMVTRNSAKQATPSSATSRIPQLSARKSAPPQKHVTAKSSTGGNRLTRTYTYTKNKK